MAKSKRKEPTQAHRTTLRTDRVYKVMLDEQSHIVDVEFETGSHPNMAARLLDYHAYLYRKDDQSTLAQELRWMGIVLRRADTVPLADKRQIEERLNMHDDLFEKDPRMQRIRAESKAEGRAEGEARGEAEGLQLALVTVVEERFPPLAELVQKKIKRIDKPDALRLLLKGITAAPDEASARLLLEPLVA